MSPAPAQLSRDQIVAAAIVVLDRDGVQAFSMRKLGTELGVDPMAIYYHLPNKAALFDAVVDSMYAQLPATATGSTWQAVVVNLFTGLRHLLLAHPRIVPIVATRPISSPGLLAVLDRVLGQLSTLGLESSSAMPLLDCAHGFTVGKLSGEVRQPVGGSSRAPEQVLAELTSDTHPHLLAALADGYGWHPDEEFQRGLTALVNGWNVTEFGG